MDTPGGGPPADTPAPASTPDTSAPIDNAASWDLDDSELLAEGRSSDEPAPPEPPAQPIEEPAGEGEEPVETDEEAPPVEAAKAGEPAKPPVAPLVKPEERPLSLPAFKPEYKPIFQAHPELQKAVLREAAYDETFAGGVTEARQLRDMFGTNQEAEQAVEIVTEALAFKRDFSDPHKFVGGLKTRFPGKLDAIATGFLNALGHADPAVYRQATAASFQNVLNITKQQAASLGGDQGALLTDAVEVLFEHLYGKDGAAPSADSRDPEFQEFKEWKASKAEKPPDPAASENFSLDVDRAFGGELWKTINDRLAQFKHISDGGRKAVAEKAFRQVCDSLAQNKVFAAFLDERMSAGPMDAKHQAEIVSFILGYTNRPLARALHEQMRWLTHDVLSTGKKRTTTKTAAASRTGTVRAGVARGGASTTSPSKPIERANVPGRPLPAGDDIDARIMRGEVS